MCLFYFENSEEKKRQHEQDTLSDEEFEKEMNDLWIPRGNRRSPNAEAAVKGPQGLTSFEKKGKISHICNNVPASIDLTHSDDEVEELSCKEPYLDNTKAIYIETIKVH